MGLFVEILVGNAEGSLFRKISAHQMKRDS